MIFVLQFTVHNHLVYFICYKVYITWRKKNIASDQAVTTCWKQLCSQNNNVIHLVVTRVNNT